jgi:hypothetical protein
MLRNPSLLLTPVCPDCGQDLQLDHIEPAEPGHDLRTFNCAGCGYTENVIFKIAKTATDPVF